jgi:hypothetical protein
MRVWIRPSFLWSCLFVVILAALAPVQAQIHGTPPSVTSLGFGGNFNPAPGVPASVTSLGPNGYGNGPGDCCFGPFFFSGPSFFSDRAPRFGEHRLHHHHDFPIGISTPVYVPYAVPYPVAYNEQDTGDDSGDVDSTYSRGVPGVYDRDARYREVSSAQRPAPRDPAPKAAAPPPAPAEAPEPAAPQPATVLVFKDGHKSEVQNYAIVGETLFDFTDGRSRKIRLADLDLAATNKANDDRGVDFQVPAKVAQTNHKK